LKKKSLMERHGIFVKPLFEKSFPYFCRSHIGLENETDFIIGEPQYDGAHSRTGGTLYVNTGKGGTYFAGSDVDLYSLFFFDYTAVRVKAGVRFIL